MTEVTKQDLVKIRNGIFEIAKTKDSNMRVPARIITTEDMLESIMQDRSLTQLINVASLPGIQKAALAMPDMHEGYGFPIGGVAALDIHNNGVISPGGIGYDINCGVRLLRINKTRQEIKEHINNFAQSLFDAIPSGLGRGSSFKVNDQELTNILKHGAARMVELGYGLPSDLEHCEESGHMKTADPTCISEKARKRGQDQLGTLGSGNHFLEIQYVEQIFDPVAAQAFGLKQDMIVVMIHCGSRGLGHQTCSEYVRKMISYVDKNNIILPDKELASVPFNSPEGQEYFTAMSAAANFAWANRHLIGHWVRVTAQDIFGKDCFADTVYDISHNIGKIEEHSVDSVKKELIVHRKGATRAFPPNHPANPATYISTGHPVFVPGTMGTSSYVLVGTQTGLEETFGSCCHGAGRRMSRGQAMREARGRSIRTELYEQNIIVKTRSDHSLAEEAPFAYKDVDNVVRAITTAQIARTVAKLKPLAVIKGD